MARVDLGPPVRPMIGAVLAAAVGLGCSVRVDYFATDGHVFVQNEPDDGALEASAAKASGVHDLRCAPDAVSVHGVPHPVGRYDQEPHEYVVDGCGQRATYKMGCVPLQNNYVQCRALLVARFPLAPTTPPRPAAWGPRTREKWRPATDHYVPSVTPDRRSPMDAAAAAAQTYLVRIHNRIHPIVAEELMAVLGTLPSDQALDGDLATRLEIVLDEGTGKLVRMGVTKPSGWSDFDIAALNAMDRAQPFGKAPDGIASPDGRVYVEWELRRDPVDACTTRNARVIMLDAAPEKPVDPSGPAP